MSTIGIYSLKGGVGKTTLAVNLGWCAATLSSRRTLLWDLDPQAASTFLLSDHKAKEQAQAVFARDVEPDKLIQKTMIDRLDLIGADTSLRGPRPAFPRTRQEEAVAEAARDPAQIL